LRSTGSLCRWVREELADPDAEEADIGNKIVRLHRPGAALVSFDVLYRHTKSLGHSLTAQAALDA
jgi:hypothetical protein